MHVWQEVEPSGNRWAQIDPTDPDLVVTFPVISNSELRIRIHWPVAWAQRVLHKAPQLQLLTTSEGDRLEITLGLSRIHQLFGSRLDLWLRRLVRVEQRPVLLSAPSLTLSAYSPIRLHYSSSILSPRRLDKDVT
ncbi:MAG: hypothetical protein ACKO6N_07635 [Myxococcota bacterium]